MGDEITASKISSGMCTNPEANWVSSSLETTSSLSGVGGNQSDDMSSCSIRVEDYRGGGGWGLTGHTGENL